MKVFRTLAFVGLTMAWPAQAADLFGSAPPMTIPGSQAATAVEIGTNWYIRGDLGVSFDDAPTVTLSSLAVPPPGVGASLPATIGPNTHSTDFTGGVGFGYRFNDYLRFDATWDYRTGPGLSRQTTVVCPYGLFGESTQTTPPVQLGYLYNTTNTCNGVTDIQQHNNTFLANAYVDLGTYYGFTPYVGGGLGLNVNSLSGSVHFYETANGQAYAANLTPIGTFPQIWVDQFGNPINPQPNIAFAPQLWDRSISTTRYTFAWALSAGFGFQLTPSATLDIGYRYLNSGANNTLINPQTGFAFKQNNSSQQVRVGIRYMLQ
jgi:opacity protein-like surface antigen